MCKKWMTAVKKTFSGCLISKAAISEALPAFKTAQLIQAEEVNYMTIIEMRNTSCKIDGKMLLIDFIKIKAERNFQLIIYG